MHATAEKAIFHVTVMHIIIIFRQRTPRRMKKSKYIDIDEEYFKLKKKKQHLMSSLFFVQFFRKQPL